MKTNKLLLPIICILFFLFSCSSTQKKGSTDNKTVSTSPENKGTNTDLTNNYVVEYDFKTRLYTHNTLKPKVHYPIIYRIKNINRFAYKIEVKSKDSVLAFSFSLDDLPKEIFVGQKKEEQATTGSNTDSTSPKPAMQVTTNDVKDVKNETPDKKDGLVDVLNSALKILELDKQIAQDAEKLAAISDLINKNNLGLITDFVNISSLLDSVDIKIEKLEKIAIVSEEQKNELESLKSVKKNLTDQKNLISTRNTLDSTLKDNVKDKENLKTSKEAVDTFIKDNEKLSVLFSQFRETYREVNKINSCYDRLYELISYHQLDYLQAQKEISPFEDEEKKFSDYKNQLQILKSNYYDIQIQYEILKRNFQLNEKLSEGGQTKIYSQGEDFMTRAKRMYEKINLTETQKKLNLMPMIIKSLKNSNTFEWMSSPIQPIGDVVSFDVDIKAKNKTGEKVIDEVKDRHQEFTRGGTRIDFGLGLAASYFKNTPVYELQVKQVNNLSQITIQQKNNELIVPSLVGLATMSLRSSTYTCIGGSAGLGIDVVNGKIQLSNFFVGPSVTFGRYERLTLTAGASFRNVQQLKSGYEIGSTVTETSDDIENYLTDKYKVGFFASLTFVLTKGVKENLKKIPSYR